ncbi:MAG: AbrB/MazE/SpoVT family DNA-binding domain-containing protein, partial [Patescibacteria group bacterium]
MKVGTTKIVRIGNSRGVRLPKTVLDQNNLSDQVSIEVQDGAVILRRENERRAGWDAQFREMAAR